MWYLINIYITRRLFSLPKFHTHLENLYNVYQQYAIIYFNTLSNLVQKIKAKYYWQFSFYK